MTRPLIALICLLLALTPGTVARADSIRKAGDVLRYSIPLYALGLTVIEEDNANGALQFAATYGVTKLATRYLKEETNKPRPDGSDRRAFPSGHTSEAFAGAGFIHRRYGIEQAWPFYVAATFVGYSRIHANRHDAIDVLGGAALGVGSAFLFARPIGKVTMMPEVSRDKVGLTIFSNF